MKSKIQYLYCSNIEDLANVIVAKKWFRTNVKNDANFFYKCVSDVNNDQRLFTKNLCFVKVNVKNRKLIYCVDVRVIYTMEEDHKIYCGTQLEKLICTELRHWKLGETDFSKNAKNKTLVNYLLTIPYSIFLKDEFFIEMKLAFAEGLINSFKTICGDKKQLSFDDVSAKFSRIFNMVYEVRKQKRTAKCLETPQIDRDK